jgi:hypothetical protein
MATCPSFIVRLCQQNCLLTDKLDKQWVEDSREKLGGRPMMVRLLPSPISWLLVSTLTGGIRKEVDYFFQSE